jgi:hypothetical protein
MLTGLKCLRVGYSGCQQVWWTVRSCIREFFCQLLSEAAVIWNYVYRCMSIMVCVCWMFLLINTSSTLSNEIMWYEVFPGEWWSSILKLSATPPHIWIQINYSQSSDLQVLEMSRIHVKLCVPFVSHYAITGSSRICWMWVLFGY